MENLKHSLWISDERACFRSRHDYTLNCVSDTDLHSIPERKTFHPFIYPDYSVKPLYHPLCLISSTVNHFRRRPSCLAFGFTLMKEEEADTAKCDGGAWEPRRSNEAIIYKLYLSGVTWQSGGGGVTLVSITSLDDVHTLFNPELLTSWTGPTQPQSAGWKTQHHIRAVELNTPKVSLWRLLVFTAWMLD